MTEKQKADTVRKQLLWTINSRDVAWFLRDESYMFLRSLNSWKLDKFHANVNLFKRFLYLLDDQNTKQMRQAIADEYYMSKRGVTWYAAKKVVDPMPITQARMIQVASKIKAMFVFQAVEFCNGSIDRMKVIDFAKIRASIVRRCKEMTK
jgi:hypothetical protein